MDEVRWMNLMPQGQVTDSEVFFVGKDVAQALGYKNPSNALQVHVDEEDKTAYPIQVSGSNYKTKVVIINESGLYSLILSPKLEQMPQTARGTGN